MNMGDVFAVFGGMLALGIALPGLLLAWSLLFPAAVRAQTYIVDTGQGGTSSIGASTLIAAGSLTCSPQPQCQNNFNFLAAGVWSEPVLAPDKLPSTRFTIKCKFTVAGKMPRADVRWHAGEGWNNVTDWYAGAVSNCTMGTIQN